MSSDIISSTFFLVAKPSAVKLKEVVKRWKVAAANSVAVMVANIIIVRMTTCIAAAAPVLYQFDEYSSSLISSQQMSRNNLND